MPDSSTESTYEVRIDFDCRVPMRDGITLSADVYRPKTDGRFPAIVVRTPYNKPGVSLDNARYFASHGYVYVAQDVRGRGDSDGIFAPYRNDGGDGYDSIEWVAEQPWCDGNVGTLGGSYLGHIQWLQALQQPPHLKTMIILVTPSDPFVEFPTGTHGPQHLCWLHYVRGRLVQNMQAVDWEKVYPHLPLITMDEQAGWVSKIWREELQHTQLDAYWEPMRYQQKFSQIDLPVLHISGWYDDEQIGTPLNFVGMTHQAPSERARRSQGLLMGPWGHAVNSTSKMGEVDFGPGALIDLRGYQLRWFDHYLKGIDNGRDHEPPVRLFIMGSNAWRDEHEWPLARSRWTRYYLHSAGSANSRFGDGRLSTEIPGSEPTDGYRYDPLRPVPFITEPTSSQIGGPDDYAAVERRDDVLVYTTPVLAEDVEVTGPVTVELHAASSAPDTDFTAKLIDVWPNGFCQRLCDGMVRVRFREGLDRPSLIEPGEIYKYTLDCWNTAQVFCRGHAIRLEIASSAFPKYDRNLNTGAPIGMTSEMVVAAQTIYHDAEHPSTLILPIVPK